MVRELKKATKMTTFSKQEAKKQLFTMKDSHTFKEMGKFLESKKKITPISYRFFDGSV